MSHQSDLWTWAESQMPCSTPINPKILSESVLLFRVDADLKMRRFYQISVARSLFGEWGVVRQWGRIGGTGRSLTEWHAAPEASQSTMAKMVGTKQRRRYR